MRKFIQKLVKKLFDLRLDFLSVQNMDRLKFEYSFFEFTVRSSTVSNIVGSVENFTCYL